MTLPYFEKWLWEITRFYLAALADFESDDYSFTFKNNGDRYTMNKLRIDTKHYRIQRDVAQNLLKKHHQKNKKDKLDKLEKTDSAFMQRKFTKFERWADDKIRALEIDLKEDRQKIRELEREQQKVNILGEELIELEEKTSKIKHK